MQLFTSCTLVQCGLLASLVSSTITHQGSLASGPDALSRWLDLHSSENDTTSTGGFTPVSARQLFGKRDDVEAGDGALLCPDGECTDGSCCSASGICGYGTDLCGDGCQSNCDATAMCGIESAGGTVKCGLDLCCSSGGWCGTAESHCIGPNQWALCQEGFGKCEIIRPATCGEDSGTSDQRMLGYYQSSNVRDRVCNKITPNQIKTDNYTHLYWAFASIDPTAFTIKLADSSDEEYAREFTALKGQGKNLETWVAVGGFDFSDNGTSTHTTWSDLCADAARRSAFIISAATFMADYGFQGIDIDWEYPVDSTRGGTDADLVNFVTLLQEMKAQFGGTFGISLTLAPDYWYLRNFDVAGLEPYVDFFGFMAYDLHGYWDADVKTLEPIVRGQADIREIYNDTIPLAYAGVDFNKINLGVAWYGRGYTLSDPSCNTLGCGFTGPNKPAACTNSAGVMSLKEIQDMIDNGEAESNLLEDAAMKELVWDDQWVGYDDEETVELKRKFANNYCFGGLMAWSVDFEPGTVSNSDDDSPAISTDGRCGPDNGGLTCVGSSFGNCCSGSGYCGSTEDYCGTGCVSGDCTVNGTTTNGRCGAGFYGATCAGTDFGSCCSAGGYCGDTDAHCGDGCQSGNCTDTDISLPGKGVDSDETCSYDYDSDDSSVVLAAWVDSGADDWFKNFLDEEGAEDWTNKFFEAVLAGGTSKGSPYDCTVMNTGQCDGPGSTLCTSYTPPETYYIHMQIGNMYSAFNMLWASTIQSAIENLSEGIKDIVDTYGTPPESDNSMMLDMFIGILTSLAGVAIEKSEAAGPFAFFSEMFSTLTESDGWSKAITPDELNDELETAYGEWFEAIMNSTYSYIENIFGGTRPDGLSDSVSLDDWVYSQFSSAQWLSKPAVDDAVTAYFDGIQKTWKEYAVTRAMKTGNTADFYLMVSNEDTLCYENNDSGLSFSQDMTEEICTDKLEACIWYQDSCVCFGSVPNGAGNLISIAEQLSGDELTKLNDADDGMVRDYEAAMKNNYDCVEYIISHQSTCNDAFGSKPDDCNISDTDIPDKDDLDLLSPLLYTKCWFNLPPLVGDNFGCSWDA